MKIPKRFHQVWFNFSNPGKVVLPPKREVELTRGWLRKHPDWEYMLWNERTCRDLISTHYPWFLEAYDSFKRPIHQVDAVRYFILDHFGGVALDFDFLCEKNIEELFTEDKEIYFALQECDVADSIAGEQGLWLCNGWIASSPKAAFWSAALPKLPDSYRKNQHQSTPGKRVINQTGPGFLSRNYSLYGRKELIKVLPKPVFFSSSSTAGCYAVHLGYHSW